MRYANIPLLTLICFFNHRKNNLAVIVTDEGNKSRDIHRINK